jgi:hypothetical protein
MTGREVVLAHQHQHQRPIVGAGDLGDPPRGVPISRRERLRPTRAFVDGDELELAQLRQLEDRLEVPSGRGVMLIRSFMTRVAYNAKGNAGVLEKVRAATDA